VPARLREQHRPAPFEMLDDRRQLEAQRDARPNHRQPVARRKAVEPRAQRRHRRLRVGRALRHAGEKRRFSANFPALQFIGASRLAFPASFRFSIQPLRTI